MGNRYTQHWTCGGAANKPKRITVGEVIDRFLTEYSKSVQNKGITKPMAYALHNVWIWLDNEELHRGIEVEDI